MFVQILLYRHESSSGNSIDQLLLSDSFPFSLHFILVSITPANNITNKLHQYTRRIEGGIGVFLKFWPIKAYRPCPQLIENGGFYTRSGQGLDEIAFGRDSKYDPME